MFVIKKQDEIKLYITEKGYFAIESDVDQIGEQVIYLSPENAISLGRELVRVAEEYIMMGGLADREELNNR